MQKTMKQVMPWMKGDDEELGAAWVGPYGGRHMVVRGPRGGLHHVRVGPWGGMQHVGPRGVVHRGRWLGAEQPQTPPGFELTPTLTGAWMAHPVQSAAVGAGIFALGAWFGPGLMEWAAAKMPEMPWG